MAQPLSQNFSKITSSNQHYVDNYDRWLFNLESYMGGDDYRNGAHLTRYQLESDSEYNARLRTTPLDNHCRSVVNVFNSFLFRQKIDRDFGSLTNEPNLKYFLQDADLEGRNFNNIMKDVATWSSVFGHCWCLLSKPNIGARTRAEELENGIRPYISILTPLVVYDWQYTRQPNGYYEITYFKYIEDTNDEGLITIIEWYKDKIVTTTQKATESEVVESTEAVNELGFIPAVIVYNQRSPIRGIGISDLTDIADQQRAIYNELSEIEQATRLDSHPTLVTPESVKLGSGAGAIAYMPETLDPGLKPYLLENKGSDITTIYKSIQARIESIDKMANTGAVRATESRSMSGVAMQTEFSLLSARLSEKSDNLELAEEQIWKLYSAYQGYVWDGEIEYPDNYEIHDEAGEIQQLEIAGKTAQTPESRALVEYKLRKFMSDPRLMIQKNHDYSSAEYQTKINILDTISQQVGGIQDQPTAEIDILTHETTTEEDRVKHIQDMIMQGYTDPEILTMHSEITQSDIDQAKQDLLTRGN